MGIVTRFAEFAQMNPLIGAFLAFVFATIAILTIWLCYLPIEWLANYAFVPTQETTGVIKDKKIETYHALINGIFMTFKDCVLVIEINGVAISTSFDESAYDQYKLDDIVVATYKIGRYSKAIDVLSIK